MLISVLRPAWSGCRCWTIGRSCWWASSSRVGRASLFRNYLQSCECFVSFFLYPDVDLRVEVSKVRVLMLDHIVLVMTTCCLPFFASDGRDWSALNVVML